ncbi:BTB/POZ domain and ankyrin repeat-containing protein NPR1-like [Populus alba x Populus x berolinensis]|nr:BTB/POZ domain and ankyrin repeat-containing protein NPR1-like [Populus alba x Populus x berolinensis]
MTSDAHKVAFARLFFPTEVKLAKDIGHAATTPEFAGLAASKGSNGNLREVDLDETPITQNIRLRSRMEALYNENRYMETRNPSVSGTSNRTCYNVLSLRGSYNILI